MILQNPRPAGLSEDMGEGGTSNFMLPTDKTHCFGKTNEPLFLREINNLIFGNQTQISSPSGKNCGRMTSLEPVALGVSMSYPKACLILLVVIPFTTALAQVSHSEQVQIAPPLIRAIDPPAPGATAAALEQQADGLRAEKLYLDALDYYHAALAKKPDDPVLLNKIGITELMMQRYNQARKAFEHAIKSNHEFADAYNNLGVMFYEEKKYGAAVKQYEKAITKDNSSASFFSNLGAAYFSKRDFEPAVIAYQHALELDPEVFERTSRAGVQAQLPSPEDRARYDYTVAKLYAKMGFSDQSLEYLKKAMEAGYKDLKNVYRDVEFAEVRKNPRFTVLMASKTTVITD
jgi:Tfp pilus assembly protein PilF